MTTRPALALGKQLVERLCRNAASGKFSIANKLSINKDLNDPNTELIRDVR